MHLSFPMRRQDITNGYNGFADLFDKYPAFQDYDQLSVEMCWILKKSSGFISETVDSWKALLPTIVDVVNVELKHSGQLKSSL
uniref:Uncharacterized protein n=1 Tax=Amphimedon queenslandica TaxID=400682 RepID=A0A1X7TM06_AMPQE